MQMARLWKVGKLHQGYPGYCFLDDVIDVILPLRRKQRKSFHLLGPGQSMNASSAPGAQEEVQTAPARDLADNGETTSSAADLGCSLFDQGRLQEQLTKSTKSPSVCGRCSC